MSSYDARYPVPESAPPTELGPVQSTPETLSGPDDVEAGQAGSGSVYPMTELPSQDILTESHPMGRTGEAIQEAVAQATSVEGLSSVSTEEGDPDTLERLAEDGNYLALEDRIG